MSFAPRLGVAITGHHLRWDQTLRIAAHADRVGIDFAIVDGDEARVPLRPRAALYDGPSLRAAVLHHTQRIRVASIQLPGFTHVVHTARGLATQQELSGGRVIGLFGVGAGRHLTDLGLPNWSYTAAGRLRALEESLAAVRQLFQGEPVDFAGEVYRLHQVTCPKPTIAVPLAVAAARPRALGLVARYADFWDVNVPPLPRFVEPLRQRSSDLPAGWIWVFARPDATLDGAIAAYRRHCPWFPELATDEYRAALLWGDPRGWPDRIHGMRSSLGLTAIVIDLIGLEESSAMQAVESLGPGRPN